MMALTMSAIDFRDAATSNLKSTLIRKHLFIKRANNKNICCILVANIVKRQADFQKDEIIFQFHQPNGFDCTINRCLKPFHTAGWRSGISSGSLPEGRWFESSSRNRSPNAHGNEDIAHLPSSAKRSVKAVQIVGWRA